MHADLRAVVEQMNPWLLDPASFEEETRRHLPERIIEREVATLLRSALADDGGRAHLVIGPRQAGKSTLVWSLVRERRPLLYLNCEEPLVRSWCESPALFVGDVKELLPRGGVLFLEEAQWLEQAGLFIKGVVDAHQGWTVVVTGSASFHLLARTRESLAGRATRHRLFPLALREIVPGDALPGVVRMRRRRALDEMLVFGSYPGVWTREAREDGLRELVEAFVMRDASDRFRIERPDAFRRLMYLGAGQVGDIVNMAEWASLTGVAATTVAGYLDILEETHIVRLIRPFIGGKRAELTKAPKLYFVDNGLRNAVAGGFGALEKRVDTGKLLENLVFTELHKRWPAAGDVRFWRTKNGAEVDFVLEPRPGVVVGLEVKAATRARLSRSARSFISAYQPPVFLLVHRGEPRAEQLDGTEIRWTPAEMLPEALDAL